MRTERIPCWDGKTQMAWVYHDGGRAEVGRKGKTGDCVTRSIAIATELPYQQVYDALNEEAKRERPKSVRGRGARSAARTGVKPVTYRRYLASLGWKWHSTMQIGSGCQVHLCEEELPGGRLIVSVSRHLTAVINRVIYDTHNPQRGGVETIDGASRIVRRCVYGYFTPPRLGRP